MTTVNVVYRFGILPAESAVLGVTRLREVYGVRHLKLDERERTILIEYDSTRLTEAVIHQMLRRAGLDLTERLPLYTVPPPAQPAPAA